MLLKRDVSLIPYSNSMHFRGGGQGQVRQVVLVQSLTDNSSCPLQALLSKTGSREFPVTLLADAKAEDACLAKLVDILSDVEFWSSIIPESSKDSVTNLLIFRTFSRMGAIIHELMRTMGKRSPLDLFQILRDPRVSEPILQKYKDKFCMLSSWAASFLKRYPTVEALKSEDSRQELLMMAGIIEVHITRIECAHASTRRCQIMTSTQTWEKSLETMSDEFALDRVRAVNKRRWPWQQRVGKIQNMLRVHAVAFLFFFFAKNYA